MLPVIATKHMVLTLLTPQYAQQLAHYRCENQAHLAPWEPLREQDYFTLAGAEQSAQTALDLYFAGTAVQLIALTPAQEEIVGICSLTNIIRGPFQACYLGYSISENCQGQGLADEMLSRALDYAFNELTLNRVMANFMPSNARSEKLLMKFGFEREGVAKRYLKIAGQWQDHVLSAKVRGLCPQSAIDVDALDEGS